MHCALALIWFAGLILGAGYPRRWLSSTRSLAVIDRVAGLVLLAFGGTLLADAVPAGPSASGVAAVMPRTRA